MIRYTFFLGTDTNGFDVDAEAIALELAAKYFPLGHSIRHETGRWQTQQGPVTEETIVVTWLAENDSRETEHQAGRFAGAYKNKAYQEAVLVTREEVDGFFV